MCIHFLHNYLTEKTECISKIIPKAKYLKAIYLLYLLTCWLSRSDLTGGLDWVTRSDFIGNLVSLTRSDFTGNLVSQERLYSKPGLPYLVWLSRIYWFTRSNFTGDLDWLTRSDFARGRLVWVVSTIVFLVTQETLLDAPVVLAHKESVSATSWMGKTRSFNAFFFNYLQFREPIHATQRWIWSFVYTNTYCNLYLINLYLFKSKSRCWLVTLLIFKHYGPWYRQVVRVLHCY